MVGFIFGGNTGETPETLKRKRSVAEALASRTSTAPKNVGEGLSAIGNALIYRSLMGKVDAGEAAGRQSAEADFAPLLGGGMSPVASALMSPPQGAASVPMSDAAGEMAATSPEVSARGTGNVYDDFIGTVKAGGVENPYALAAIAATGDAESGFDATNAKRTWSDPSESGKPGTAGGIMSWRGPRYQALASTGDLSPAGQAKFFLKEDPTLIASLSSAKSVEEAQQLMNRAWAFAGHDRPGGEAARRMKLANSYLPRFQGGNAEVASLDPSAGMSAAGAIDAAATPSGSVDPVVNAQPAAEPAFDMGRFSPNIKLAEMPPTRADIAPQMQQQTASLDGMSPVASALLSPAPQPAPGSTVAAALANPTQPQAQMAPSASSVSTPSMPVTGQPQPQQVAQANNSYFPAPPTPSEQSGPSMQQIMRVLNNPNATQAQRAYAASLLERQQRMSDPSSQLDMEVKRAQLDALRAKPGDPWEKLDDGTLYRKSTGETKCLSKNGDDGAGLSEGRQSDSLYFATNTERSNGLDTLHPASP